MAQEIGNAEIYSPRKVLEHPEFRILANGEKPPKTVNIAAFYNPAHEIHLVEKPILKPGPGQVLLHVRATGICGYNFSHYTGVGRSDVNISIGVMSTSGSMDGSGTPW